MKPEVSEGIKSGTGRTATVISHQIQMGFWKVKQRITCLGQKPSVAGEN